MRPTPMNAEEEPGGRDRQEGLPIANRSENSWIAGLHQKGLPEKGGQDVCPQEEDHQSKRLHLSPASATA